MRFPLHPQHVCERVDGSLVMDFTFAIVERLVLVAFDAVHRLVDHVPPLAPSRSVVAHAAELYILHAKAEGGRIEAWFDDEGEQAFASSAFA